jgi:hypothetical protein
MEDRIETIGRGSVIQHGKLNNRIYLIKLGKSEGPDILDVLRQMAVENAYTKIFCKVPEWAAPLFIADGLYDRSDDSKILPGEGKPPFLWPSTRILTG